MSLPAGLNITLPIPKGGETILTPEALKFLTILHRTFDKRRRELLENRKKVQAELDKVRKPLLGSEHCCCWPACHAPAATRTREFTH